MQFAHHIDIIWWRTWFTPQIVMKCNLSITTKRHDNSAIDFATVSGVVGRTHAFYEIYDLLMTDVPDLITVAIVAQYTL